MNPLGTPQARPIHAAGGPAIRVRVAGPSNVNLLAELGRRTFAETFGPDNTPQDMDAYLADSFGVEKQATEMAEASCAFLIAESEGAAVGYARLRESQRPRAISGERPIEIHRFYAVREWIGRGVGAALMEACLAEASRRGCDVIWLDVWERNARALAFYRRWGFHEVGTQSFQLGSDLQNDLLLERRVAAATE